MMLSAALLLTLVQAPAPGAEIMYASAPRVRAMSVDDGIRALALSGDPVLANGIVVVQESPAAPIAIRTGPVDAWGCLYGLRICLHESAIVIDNRVTGVRRYVPAWSGSQVLCRQVIGYSAELGASCYGWLPGCGDLQCDLYWQQYQIAREFEETSVGLRTGKAIMAARRQEAAAAARGSSNSRSGSSLGHASPTSGGGASAGSAYSGSAARSSSGSSRVVKAQ